MKKIKIILGCVIIACIALFYYFTTDDYQRIHSLDHFPRSGVNAYVYSMGCMLEKEDYTQIDPSDYESLLQLVSKIKYMNPNIDPTSVDYIVYGGGGYKFEIFYEDTVITFGISCNELEPNIRRVTLSDGNTDTCIAAYVKNDIYNEYERLAQKYIKESENGS